MPVVIDRVALRLQMSPVLEKGAKYLLQTQAANGGWLGPFGESDPAITALAARALAQYSLVGPKHIAVQRALAMVLKHQQPDGGIYNPKVGYANYTTSVALMFLAGMNDPALRPAIEQCQRYLKTNQWADGKEDTKGNNVDPAHPWYGGAGYGKGKRPDLSNTQMMIEALSASGLPADDPAYKRAMRFISRCQMLEGNNDQPFAKGATDGGFIYSPASGGESKAGTVEQDGGKRLRSYGSMTYAGFKSMLYARLDRTDPRVRAAWEWIQHNYTLDSNPNMPGTQSQEGLYYYYMVFAKALSLWGEPTVTDAAGTVHDWRAELCQQLAQRQRPDGSWINPADRWMEGIPYLVTSYGMLAIEAALE